MSRVFNIPMSDTLVKFCQRDFFAGLEAPYFVEEGSLIGKEISRLLLDKRKPGAITPDITRNAVLSIALSGTLAKRSPSHAKLNKINSWVELYFRQALKIYCAAQISAGIYRTEAVRSFLSHYDIHTDANFIACYKLVTRHEEKAYRRAKKRNAQKAHSLDLFETQPTFAAHSGVAKQSPSQPHP